MYTDAGGPQHRAYLGRTKIMTYLERELDDYLAIIVHMSPTTLRIHNERIALGGRLIGYMDGITDPYGRGKLAGVRKRIKAKIIDMVRYNK